jgi:hypothetical protein
MPLRTEPAQYYNSTSHASAVASVANWEMGHYFVVSVVGSVLWGARLWSPLMAVDRTWAIKVYAPGVSTPEFTHNFVRPAGPAAFHVIEFSDSEKITWTDAMVAAQNCSGATISNQWCLSIVDTATLGSRYRIGTYTNAPEGPNRQTHFGWCLGRTNFPAWVNYAGTAKPTVLDGNRVPLDPIIYGWAEEYSEDAVSSVVGPDGTARVSTKGGDLLEVAGKFQALMPMQAYFGENGDGSDTPCYFGQGYGYSGMSADGTTVTVIAPPHPKSTTAYLTLVVDGKTLVSPAIDVVERNWPGKIHRSRASFAPWNALGARRLSEEGLD